jgi:hypothetical protein
MWENRSADQNLPFSQKLSHSGDCVRIRYDVAILICKDPDDPHFPSFPRSCVHRTQEQAIHSQSLGILERQTVTPISSPVERYVLSQYEFDHRSSLNCSIIPPQEIAKVPIFVVTNGQM